MIDAFKYADGIRALCSRYYIPNKTLSDGKPNPDDHPTMRSEALHAVNCMVSVSRIFKLLETFDAGLVMLTVVDLSFGLSENRFWEQHKATLIPTFKSALHAYLGAVALSANGQLTAEQEELVNVQKRQWHSLFLVAYDCLYGVSNTILVAPIFAQDITKAV
jgi:hypothetical protein